MLETSSKPAAKSATGTVEDSSKPNSGEINAQAQAETDGFTLVIDALKLNGIDTIFGLPGIPITDLTRRLQAAGIRVISFRHGHLPDGLRSRLSQRAHRARQRHDQLLPYDPDQRLERAGGRRPAAG